MPLSIHYNAVAARASHTLQQTQSSLTDVLMQLTTGKRVNKAADDPAGLAIATNLSARARSLDMAMRNASDGISTVQIAEGATNTVVDLVTRARTLAVQSASETLADSERSFIQDEYNEIFEEISRLSTAAEYNGIVLTSGGSLSVQVGPDNNTSGTIDIQLGDLRTTVLGIDAVDLSTRAGASSALDAFDAALSALSSQRSLYGATQNRLESALENANTYQTSLTEAASNIMDVDYAKASTEMARLQIMQQAGAAALVQAKNLTQSVVSLLN